MAHNQTTLRLTAQQRFEANARKRLIKLLDKAMTALYEARMENNGAVLSMNIKELYNELTKN